MSADAPVDRRPKILFALPALGAGGSERVVTALANHWAESRRDVSITTFEPGSKPPYYSLDPAIGLHRLDLPPISKPKWRALHRTAERIGALRRLFRRESPDVIISFLTKMNVMSVLAAQGLGIPVVISERNNPKLQQFDRLWATARGLAYPRAYSFVTMTEGAAEFYPAKQRPRTQLIPNPVTLPAGWTNKRGGKTVAAVGRLTAQKRFDRLIEAFASVAGEFPDWNLVIWGEGELRQALEAQVRNLAPSVQTQISLPGVTPSPGSWIETTDVFVLSSDYEGWPNVIAEAMTAALPIVSTDCEFGVKDMIEHGRTGMLAPMEDVTALADALRSVLADESLRNRLAQNAAEKAAQYTVENVAAQWNAVIDKAVSES